MRRYQGWQYLKGVERHPLKGWQNLGRTGRGYYRRQGMYWRWVPGLPPQCRPPQRRCPVWSPRCHGFPSLIPSSRLYWGQHHHCRPSLGSNLSSRPVVVWFVGVATACRVVVRAGQQGEPLGLLLNPGGKPLLQRRMPVVCPPRHWPESTGGEWVGGRRGHHGNGPVARCGIRALLR